MSNDKLFEYCYLGDIKSAINELKLGATNYNKAMVNACLSDNIDLIKLMISLGANNYEDGLYRTCSVGNMETTKLMLSLGAKKYNDGLSVACRNGHGNIIKLMIDLGADDYEYVFIQVCHNSDIDNIRFVLDAWRKSNPRNLKELKNAPQTMLEKACIMGNMNVVKFALELGANDYNDALAVAIRNDNMHIAKFMIECGATEIIYTYIYKGEQSGPMALLEIGLDISYLKPLDEFNSLVSNINNFKAKTKQSLSPYLLDPVISIIQSYSLL